MKKKILFVAGRERTYSRTHILFSALVQQGYEITGCFPPDRSFRHYPGLIWRAMRQSRQCDLVLVGFYGQIILPWVRLLTRKPLLFDMYITTLDTMVYDRGKAKPGSLKARIYGWSDWLSYKLSDLAVLETQAHIDFFCHTFAVDATRMRRIFLAVDDSIIYPRKLAKDTAKFVVHFHGEYAPFHGIRYILQAAHLLQGERDIEFRIIGKGITYAQDQQLAKELKLENVRFSDPVSYAELAQRMAQADICLGVFGDNDRVLRVTTNKVVEAIAMAKPLISARNEPIQELLTHGESVYLVERANPQALAQAILELKNLPELREQIASGGFRVFKEHCTMQRIGEAFAKIIEEMCGDES